MREELLEFLTRYRKIDEIQKALEISGSKGFVKLVKTLNEMVDEAVILYDEKKGYILASALGVSKGRVIKKNSKSDFAFVRTDEEDIYVHEMELDTALDGDIVLVRKMWDATNDRRAEGAVVKILERARIIGSIGKRSKGEYYLNAPISNTILNMSKDMLDKIVVCEVVGVKAFHQYGKSSRYQLKIVDVITSKKDKRADVETYIYKYGFSKDFSEEVLDYVNSIEDKDDFKDRVDLTSDLTFTIDGADAKDLDDAVSVTRVGENFNLKVSIADVSYYVKEDSILDKEAFKRSTSVYLADRVLPMLPERLSNDLCSLNPNTIKKTITCEMLISGKNGKTLRHKIYPSFIKTKERLAYDKVNELYEGKHSFSKETDEAMFILKDLQEVLYEKRKTRGSLDFESIEPQINLDSDNNVISIEVRERGIAERVIEECMLAANETVAEHMYFLELPMIYRIHDKPDYERLNEVIKMVDEVEFKGNLTNQKHLQNFVEALKESDEGAIYNSLVLRCMAKARYSASYDTHYGLAAKYYTHFTSPIRRYPDLMVHRLLRTFVFNEYKDSSIEHFDKILGEISNYTSNKERDSIDIERDVDKLFMCKYLEGNKETFTGVVTSVTNFGLFVTLENGIEGLVHISNIPGYYDYDASKCALVGPETYTLGDKLVVKVYNIIKEELKIDFRIVKRG